MIETCNVTDPAAAAAFGNARRRRILLALVEREYALTQLSALTGDPMNLLHYHIGKLRSLGLVKLTRRQARAGAPINFYRAAAKTFVIPAELAHETISGGSFSRLHAGADSRRSGTVKGVIFSNCGGGPRVHLVRDHDKSMCPVELRLELRLSPADAALLADEFKAVVKRFAQRTPASGHRYAVHTGVALL